MEILYCPVDTSTVMKPVIPHDKGAFKADGGWRIPGPDGGSVALVPDEYFCPTCGTIWAIKRVGIVC